MVFSEPDHRRQLESILHPRIRERWKSEAEKWRKEAFKAGAILIPLLFETGAESEFDHIICVACSGMTQKARLGARGWSEEEQRQRIEAQWPVEKKVARSDFVVWTEGTMEVHQDQIDRILLSLQIG
jgi:dephospho-CoA kinase